MITKKMIEKGIEDKVINLVEDTITEGTIVCKIGNLCFCFTDNDISSELLDTIYDVVPKEKIIEKIYNTLMDFYNEWDMFADDYIYCEAILKEAGILN